MRRLPCAAPGRARARDELVEQALRAPARPAGALAAALGVRARRRRPHGRGHRQRHVHRGRRRRGDVHAAVTPLHGELLAHVRKERVVGVLLVRLGGHAAGVFAGRRLVAAKVGSRPVHGRRRAGGSSSGRFARRREGQARVALEAAAAVAARVLAEPARVAVLASRVARRVLRFVARGVARGRTGGRSLKEPVPPWSHARPGIRARCRLIPLRPATARAWPATRRRPGRPRTRLSRRRGRRRPRRRRRPGRRRARCARRLISARPRLVTGSAALLLTFAACLSSCASRARISRRSWPSRRPIGPRVCRYLRESDADRILSDVEDFGRRQPWAVIAGGVALGLVASRFLKASSTRRYDQRSANPRSPARSDL